MKRIDLMTFAAALLASTGAVWAATPPFVHKINITQYLDSGATLPVKGTVVAGGRNGGLYSSSLGNDAPALIPNTAGEYTTSTQITEDGQWVLYNGGGVKLIRVDGMFKTTVPATNPSTSDGSCTFWWNAPSGKLEVVYRENGDKTVHAVPVTFSTNAAPTFGTDRVIAQFTKALEFSMGCARDHFFARIDYDPNSGVCNYGPAMVTLPGSGAAATDSNVWHPATGNGGIPQMGCMCTLSHNGAIGCFNPGYDQWCCCMADEFCLLRHKSFILVPFQEKTAPPVAWQTALEMSMAFSVNWAPKKYLFLSPTDSTQGLNAVSSNFWSDFKDWNYTNDTSYIVGDGDCIAYGNCSLHPDSCAGSRMPDSGTIWLVNYNTNTWTMILHLPAGVRLSHPAVWICQDASCQTGTIAPVPGNHLAYRGIPLQGNKYIVDIRGRFVPDAQSTSKLMQGVYYSVAPDGRCKRILVSHR
ncbi:MAG TPA: hypothetical protein VLX68_10845 [Chitinivibrionales bacterium]|nr:hypothetical protein [Chitinivibrionales bacterium]